MSDEQISDEQISDEQINLEELQEQVTLKLYDLMSNPKKYAEEWKTFEITQEMADKEIAAFHEKFGIPDMSKLKE